MKLQKYTNNFIDNKYDKVVAWPKLTNSELQKIGLNTGAILKWRKKFPV